MKEITEELRNRKCVICMNCGKIYEEATEEDFDWNNCSCSMGWFNDLEGRMDSDFWGSDAARDLAKRIKPFSEESDGDR